jgi:hypothetical protein
MRPTLILLALFVCACGSKTPEAPAAPATAKPAPDAPAGRVIKKMQLSETDTSHIAFESAYSRGTIDILPGVRIGYASATSNGVVHQSLTLQDKQFLFDGPDLVIGPKSYGALSGQVAIVIGPEGVTINGERRGAL